jgi:predicted metallopeptidase
MLSTDLSAHTAATSTSPTFIIPVISPSFKLLLNVSRAVVWISPLLNIVVISWAALAEHGLEVTAKSLSPPCAATVFVDDGDQLTHCAPFFLRVWP